jgi:arsenite oxidase small subunit
VSSADSEKNVEMPKKRRSFLKSIFAAGVAATVIGLASALRIFFYAEAPSQGGQTSTTGPSWPRFKLLNVSALELLKPVSFNYPLTNTPNYLVKLGVKAEYGIGPDSDIVAFSGICQHLGCFYGFQPPGTSPACNAAFKASAPEGYCCCHGSVYDFARDAAVVSGPAPRPIPRVMLEYDSKTGDIYVAGMAPPTIYGHGPPGTTDPSLVLQYDLQGGTLVTESTLFSGSSS